MEQIKYSNRENYEAYLLKEDNMFYDVLILKHKRNVGTVSFSKRYNSIGLSDFYPCCEGFYLEEGKELMEEIIEIAKAIASDTQEVKIKFN